jgi:hypothetical protein
MDSGFQSLGSNFFFLATLPQQNKYRGKSKELFRVDVQLLFTSSDIERTFHQGTAQTKETYGSSVVAAAG